MVVSSFLRLISAFCFQVQPKPEKKPGTPPPAPATVAPPQAPRSPSPPPAPAIISPPPAINIPRFYYPRGLPAMGPAATHDSTIAAIETAFAELEEEKADIYEMGKIAKVKCWKTLPNSNTEKQKTFEHFFLFKIIPS